MNKGMTLVEVLVVIAMILIMLSVVTINPRPSVELDRAARRLASDLRRAQNMAMSVEEQGGVVPYGYGVYFNRNNRDRYILFADRNNNKRRDGGEDVETTLLQGNITISNDANFNVFFEAPSGVTTIPSNPFNITLKASDGSTRNITVSSTGKIEL